MWKKLLALSVSLLIPLSGCTLLGGNSDYDSHTRARVEFKQSDDARIAAQADSIAEIAKTKTETAEGAAYQKSLGMISITLLRNQEYGEKAPLTMTEGVVRVAEVGIPLVSMGLSNTSIAKEGIRAAGNVEIGANSTVSGSFNKPTATSLGDGTATAAPAVEVVEQPAPIIIEPTIIQGVNP